jgi:hypothetical protein
MSGDVILKIDGVSVTSASITSAMIGRDIPGAPLILTIAKGGIEVSFKYSEKSYDLETILTIFRLSS